MARLKLWSPSDVSALLHRLTDRIRDGAIETHCIDLLLKNMGTSGLPIGFAMARLKQYLLVEEARLGRRGLPIGFAMARLKRFVLELTNDDFPPMAYRSDSRWRD